MNTRDEPRRCIHGRTEKQACAACGQRVTPMPTDPETHVHTRSCRCIKPRGMQYAATPPSPAPEGERTLDAAWADLRAVLPDEWIVILYDSGPPTTYNPGPESPFHGPRYLARADIGIRSGPPRISAQSDESPAAALDALRAALAATAAHVASLAVPIASELAAVDREIGGPA